MSLQPSFKLRTSVCPHSRVLLVALQETVRISPGKALLSVAIISSLSCHSRPAACLRPGWSRAAGAHWPLPGAQHVRHPLSPQELRVPTRAGLLGAAGSQTRFCLNEHWRMGLFSRATKNSLKHCECSGDRNLLSYNFRKQQMNTRHNDLFLPEQLTQTRWALCTGQLWPLTIFTGVILLYCDGASEP